MPRSTFRHWKPLVHGIDSTKQGQPSLTFIGLVEAFVLSTFRQAGVPFQRIRPALTALAEEIGLEHALASRRLYTDGAEILYDWSVQDQLSGEPPIAELVIVGNGQWVFPEVIAAYLRRITWGNDGFPTMLELPIYQHAHVVADPFRAFGQPIFTESAVKVEDVLQRFWSGDDLNTVAEEFGLAREEVEDALRVASRPAS